MDFTESLNLNNILDLEEIPGLFEDNEPSTPNNEGSTGKNTETPLSENNNGEENKQTTEVDVNSLFTDKPESVGSEEEHKEKKDTTTTEGGTSPKNFYSSMTKALVVDGVFPDLDEEAINNIKNPEDFVKILKEWNDSRYDEVTKRVNQALEVGVEVSDIRKYENTIQTLNNIQDSLIEEEGEQGERLRKQLIFQDYINKGFSEDRAKKELNKSLNAGTDVEDAKEALKSNIQHFKEEYQFLIDDAKKEEEKLAQARKEQVEQLKNSILNDAKVFGDVDIDKSTRQKVFDNISKPVYRDPESGDYLTALLKYEIENRSDFIKNIGLLFTLTDGFKDINKLVKGKVNKEVRKGLRELEHTLNNTSRTSDGSLRFVSNVENDPESFIGNGWKLDV